MLRTPLTQTAADRLPLDRIITVGGIQIHTAWFGGIRQGANRYDNFTEARYGYAKDCSGDEFTDDFVNIDGEHVHRVGYYAGNPLEEKYIAANARSITVPAICSMLVDDGWKFFSSTIAAQFMWTPDDPVPRSISDFVMNPYDAVFTNWANSNNPAMQHYPFCAMTNTRRPDGRYALYAREETEELASALSFLNGSGTLVLAIDGTGSYGSGQNGSIYISEVLSKYINQRSTTDHTRLVVTKFSDDFDHQEDMYDGVIIGDYQSISLETIPAAAARIRDFKTGNGGDTNETQLMGMYVGMERVRDISGPKAVVVYTDAASVCPMPFNTTAPTLRQRHRDDGLAAGSREEKGHGSSQQTSLRRGGRVYF